MSLSEHAMWQERALTGKNADELQRGYEELLRSVKRIDPLTLAEATDGKYRADGVPRVEIAFLHSWFVLDLLPYRVRAGHPEVDTLPMKVSDVTAPACRGRKPGKRSSCDGSVD